MAGDNAARPEPKELLLGLPRNLALRILSTAVILPPAALFIMLGDLYFAGFVALIGGCMAWEWSRIVHDDDNIFLAIIAAAGCGIVVGTSALIEPRVVGYCLVGLLILVLLAASIAQAPRRTWIVLGCVIACAPCLATLWLRENDPLGLPLLVWLITSVAATDIGAYITGKSIGGARLAPRISPKKTWSGLVGGMVASGGIGFFCGSLIDPADPKVLAVAGAMIAVIAQIGDLLESGFKRRFSVKDSGTLIPGHGGVLDRLDGHMTVITVVAIIAMVSGQSPLLW
ncbi:MAG: phosphatidate cytidylyltransferase [Alphaproteobacteria bacterium]|nr:phosphatidate cytidylyltransferase [Alphaproteobacteria bacterium]